MIRNTVAQMTVAITLIVLIGLGLTTFLDYFKFERSFSLLISSRFDAVLRDMKNTIETSLALGLPLNSLRNTQALIEREVRYEPLILSIEIFESDGNVVFATDRDFINDLMKDEWIAAWRDHDPSGAWRLREQDALVLGVSLVNNFNLEVGGIALRLSRDFYASSLRAMLVELGVVSLLILAVVMVISFLGAFWLLRTIRNPFSALADSLDTLARDSELPAPIGNTSDQTGKQDKLALAATIAAIWDIEYSSREIRRLDDEG